jgi:hypothetical protein
MSIIQSNEGMSFGDFLGRGWKEASIRTNDFISSKNINRKYLKYGGYAAAGVGGIMAAGSMYSSYGKHGTAANVYTSLNTLAGGIGAGLIARKAGMSKMGIGGMAALGAFNSDRFSRFQENHPVVGTVGVAALGLGGSFAYRKYKPQIESAFRRWSNKWGASTAKRAASAMRMV